MTMGPNAVDLIRARGQPMFGEGGGKTCAQNGLVEAVRLPAVRRRPCAESCREDGGAKSCCAMGCENLLDLAQKHLIPLHQRSAAVEGDDFGAGANWKVGCERVDALCAPLIYAEALRSVPAIGAAVFVRKKGGMN